MTNAGVLPNAVSGVNYSFTLNASGGTGPYVWSGTPGAGLMLNPSTGVISGIPSGNSGIYEFPVTVTDSAPQANSITVLVSFYLDLPNPELLMFQSCAWCAGGRGSECRHMVIEILPAGGVPPYTVSWRPDLTLPPGLSP